MDSDKTRLRALIDQIESWVERAEQTQSDAPYPTPLVSIDDFFIGNPNTSGAFAANLENHPGEDAIYHRLQMISARADVYGIWVGVIQAYPEALDESDGWAYSDHLYIATHAHPDEIAAWFEEYYPDEINLVDLAEWHPVYPLAIADVPIYFIFWD
ncbi:MAG: hypothetical protein MUF87_12370 [Anaerolineae bacterium]|jgi:hypothetical protein|nr:hypothetical protein [Anaerolineae bacterium]